MQQWKIFVSHTEHHPSDMYSPSTLRLMIDTQPDPHRNRIRLEIEEERVVSELEFDFLALRALRDQFDIAVKEKNYPGATIKLPEDKLILRYNNRGDPFDEGIEILIRPNNIADDDYRFDEPHVFVDKSELSFAVKYIDDILKA